MTSLAVVSLLTGAGVQPLPLCPVLSGQPATEPSLLCVRGVGYEHRYCCTVHANPGADHGDYPPAATRCRAWPRMADVA